MLLRSLLMGVLLATLLVSSLATGLVEWAFGVNETYVFGSLIDALVPTVLSASGLPAYAQFVFAAIVAGCLVALTAVLWPLAERAATLLAAVVAELRPLKRR